MTGWGEFWNVYRRGSTVTPVQTSKDPAKKVNQQATRRTMATTATKPVFPRKLTEEEKAWANEFDDVSGCLLFPSLNIMFVLISHLECDVSCSIMQLLVDVSFWCDS
jgi:hypothetical protein